MNVVLELRTKVITERARYQRGEITLAQLYATADEYIAAATEHVKTCSPTVRRRFRPPTRAYLLRAL